MAGLALLFALLAGTALAAVPASSDIPQLFARADSLKTSDNPDFAKLLQQLEGRAAELSDAQKWQLRYMRAWQTAYLGQNEKARLLLEAVAKQAPDRALRFEATATLINILGISHQYEEAFQYLDVGLDNLPQITDKHARFHLLAEASQLLTEAGQYDLAVGYADQIVNEYPDGRNGCIGGMIKLHTQFLWAQTKVSDALFQQGIDRCLRVGEHLAADTILRDMASLAIEQNRLDAAIALLQGNYADVQRLQYQDLTSEYDALIAEAYWKKGDAVLAQKYATATIDIASKSDFTEPLIKSYELLYQIDREQGNLREALAYHEKYVEADKGHLDNVREKALAYQIVKQQIDAKKIELNELNRQNQILHLQQALDHKAVETGRLYIALLLTVLASIAFWLFRLKRSQLRFMRLARRDGLTGIFNRQHFMDEAEQTLRYAAKSLRGACLILIDLDHFKDVNDTYGHIVGDHILKRAVTTCQKHLHSCDVFGRIGGEEFGILLPECSLIQALERAEQIRAAIQDGRDDEFQHVAISASFGIASTAHYGYDFRRLLLAADGALYRAKRDGRNRVVVSMNESPPASNTHKHASLGSSALGSTSSVAE